MPQEKDRKEADYVLPELKENGLVKDTTVSEKIQVFQVSQRISRYLSGLLFATGAISLLLSAEYFLGARLLLTLELRTLFLAALGFIGGVNLVCGLLLLAKE